MSKVYIFPTARHGKWIGGWGAVAAAVSDEGEGCCFAFFQNPKKNATRDISTIFLFLWQTYISWLFLVCGCCIELSKHLTCNFILFKDLNIYEKVKRCPIFLNSFPYCFDYYCCCCCIRCCCYFQFPSNSIITLILICKLLDLFKFNWKFHFSHAMPAPWMAW